MRIKFVSAFAAAVIVFLTSITILGQKGAVCKIGTTTFDCPAGFLKLPDVDATTRLFQSKDKDNPLKLFVAVSAGDFVDSVLRQTHERSYSIPASERFEWKTVTNPLTMDVETKYKHRVIASLGFWNKHLLEMKSFIFSVKAARSPAATTRA